MWKNIFGQPSWKKKHLNPFTGKYAWVGLDQCEGAYLNDFRWSRKLIACNDLLLLLEEQIAHWPDPIINSSWICLLTGTTIFLSLRRVSSTEINYKNLTPNFILFLSIFRLPATKVKSGFMSSCRSWTAQWC